MNRTATPIGRFSIPIIAIVLFMSLFVPSDNPAIAQEYFEWSIQSPGIESCELKSVCALDESHVWAVGESGKIGFFDGTSWSVQESGTWEDLHSVSALDESHVWAVG
ncbi:MAG: hypothetical protein JW854_15395, partial [Actinobacteria bacterium]|nr:hypothetical protein [Actinomycetota bacterium]